LFWLDDLAKSVILEVRIKKDTFQYKDRISSPA
jgi:hypothetical protein